MSLSRRRPEAKIGRTGIYHPSANETDQQWRDRWKFRGEVIALIVVIVGAVIGIKTLRELTKQTAALGNQNITLQKQTAILDAQARVLGQQVYAGERAYLLVQNVRLGAPGPLTAETLPDLHWETVNVGGTPAKTIRTAYAIYYGDRAAPPPEGKLVGYSEGRALGPGEREESPSVVGIWPDNA